MNVLIIGGAGFVGINLVRRCLEESGIHLTVLDSLDPVFQSKREHLNDLLDKIEFVEGDLLDQSLLEKLVKERDVIFNCAAQSAHTYSLKNPLLDAEINCLGNLALLESIRTHNPGATVVYPSSSTVIGKACHPVVTEDHTEHPLDIYSANKSVAEKYYGIYHSAHGLNTVCLRFANLYGPFGKESPEFGFINYFIGLARAGEEIPVFGDGGQRRNVMYVKDAVDILWISATESRLVGAVHFAAGDEHYTVREVAEKIVSVFPNGRIREVDWPEERRRLEVNDVTISSDKLRKVVTWRPRFDFVSGLHKTKAFLDRA